MPIKRAGGEKTMNGGSFVKFPDVLLFSDHSRTHIIQGWEAKCPDVPIDDPAFVNDAHTKAKLLQCDSTVLWNFQYAQLHVCNADGEFEIIKSWTIDERIVDRETVSLYEREWIAFLHELIDTISELLLKGTIRNRNLGEVLTESIMPQLINENKGLFAETLKARAARDITIKAHVDSWWEAVKEEYVHDERDPYAAYAKIVLINWLNKFLFANLIQNQFSVAQLVGDITGGCRIQEAIDVFGRITGTCDFFNVFSFLPFSNPLPDDTWDDLITFNELLLECDMRQLDSSYSHQILEESISVARRQVAGQYPTPEPLALLLSEMAVRDSFGNAWDCCCGTGTIGCALWKRKNEILSDAHTPNANQIAFETTWMSDIHDFPLQIATQGLASLSPSKLPLRVIRENVFDAKAGMDIQLIDPETGEKRIFQFPRFKTIASNLPFVDFNTKDASSYERVKNQIKSTLRDTHHITLSDRSDLYSYITLYLNTLLDEEGCMCLLTSNSWLCTAAGDGFMQALQVTFDVDAIYVNGASRWFKNADVMNAILILKKNSTLTKPQCYLGSINASIDDLSNNDIRASISRRAISHSSSCDCLDESLVTWDQMKQLRDLGLSYYAMCHDVAFLLEMSGQLCKASSLFEIKRGTKSGQDDFFYSSDAKFVEEEFRVDLLKNFRDITHFELRPSWYAFNCDKSLDYLKENGYQKALRLIQSVSKPNQSCISHKPYWYSLPGSGSIAFATAMNPSSRLFFAGAPEGKSFAANQRAICFTPLVADLDKELVLALLNSTLGMLMIEAANAPMALGALDTRAETFRNMSILNPDLLSREQRDEIVSAFEILKGREIKSALEELSEEDRATFDSIVLRAYGLEQFDEQIRSTLKKLLTVRLRRPQANQAEGKQK